MKIKDIRKLKGAELEKKLAEINTELIKLQGQSATGTPPKSPGQIKQMKKIIAKIKTVQREEQLQAISAGAPAEIDNKMEEK